MIEEFEYKGYWWPPQNPDFRIPGTLKFDPCNEISLELLDSFSRVLPGARGTLSTDIILGVADGRNITLVDCRETRSKFTRFPTTLSSRCNVDMVLVGHHFNNPADIAFDTIFLGYPLLEDWVGLSGFHDEVDYDSENQLKRWVLTCEPVERVAYDFDGFKVSFEVILHCQADDCTLRDFKQQTRVVIEFEEAASIDKILHGVCGDMNNFLALAMHRSVQPSEIWGRNKNIVDPFPGSTDCPEIGVYFTQMKANQKKERLRPHEVLFTFTQIRDTFRIHFSKWIEKSHILRPVCNLYFATIYSSSMYIQHEFLNYVHALEVYHRRTRDGRYLSDEGFASVLEQLINAIPREVESKIREDFSGKLQYLNEYSLRRRIKDILGSMDPFANYIGIDGKAFVDNVVNARNYRIHFDKNRRSPIESTEEWSLLARQLKFLVEMCFLLEIGFSNEQIMTTIRKNSAYQHLRGQLLHRRNGSTSANNLKIWPV